MRPLLRACREVSEAPGWLWAVDRPHPLRPRGHLLHHRCIALDRRVEPAAAHDGLVGGHHLDRHAALVRVHPDHDPRNLLLHVEPPSPETDYRLGVEGTAAYGAGVRGCRACSSLRGAETIAGLRLASWDQTSRQPRMLGPAAVAQVSDATFGSGAWSRLTEARFTHSAESLLYAAASSTERRPETARPRVS